MRLAVVAIVRAVQRYSWTPLKLVCGQTAISAGGRSAAGFAQHAVSFGSCIAKSRSIIAKAPTWERWSWVTGDATYDWTARAQHSAEAIVSQTVGPLRAYWTQRVAV